MTAQQYLSVWTRNGDQVSPISSQKLADFNLRSSTKIYLEAGLPKAAAPFLSFADGSDDAYTAIAKLEDQYDLDIEPNKYVVIGSDGGGNPVAVNTQKDDVIEWLDHEDYFAPSYFNRSMECLLSFLIIYRDFIQEITEHNGPAAYFDASFTDDQYDALKQRMIDIDPDAVNENGFWKEELEVLLVNRDYYRANP